MCVTPLRRRAYRGPSRSTVSAADMKLAPTRPIFYFSWIVKDFELGESTDESAEDGSCDLKMIGG
jgi:hypothetical protein